MDNCQYYNCNSNKQSRNTGGMSYSNVLNGGNNTIIEPCKEEDNGFVIIGGNYKNANSQYYTVSNKNLRISDVKPLSVSRHQFIEDGDTLLKCRNYFPPDPSISAYQI